MLLFTAVPTAFGFLISLFFSVWGGANFSSTLFSIFSSTLLAAILAITAYKVFEKNVPELFTLFKDLGTKTNSKIKEEQTMNVTANLEEKAMEAEGVDTVILEQSPREEPKASIDKPAIEESLEDDNTAHDNLPHSKRVDEHTNSYKEEDTSSINENKNAFTPTKAIANDSESSFDRKRDYGSHQLKDKVEFKEDPRLMAQAVHHMLSQDSEK